LRQGYELQQDGNAKGAEKAYQACLKADPNCISCLYELGWSHWKLGNWKEVVQTWETVLKKDPHHADAAQYLPSAKETLAALEKKIRTASFRTATELLTESVPADGPLTMLFSSRWQSYNSHPKDPLDHYDPEIDSPKSIAFNAKGNLVFLNSLEAGRTIVYDSVGLAKKGVIPHRFEIEDAKLFSKKAPFGYRFPNSISVAKPNVFTGKPVESTLSHGGRYLWVTYYRRSYDPYGNFPSALAVVDTQTLEIVRVFGTGPISKYVQVSPDGKWLAVSHWGDNTVGLFDISAQKPSGFREAALLTVEKQLKTGSLKGNRDKNCGYCVRGLAFSQHGRYLFVGRMRQGGIAAFDLKPKKPVYLGTVFGINPGPRDLHLSRSGDWLYSSCNASGFISKVSVKMLVKKFETLKKSGVKKITIRPKDEKVESVFAGLGVRSFKLSPDDKYLFAAVNQTSEVVAIRTEDMKMVSRIPVDSYPVGLDISPDGSQLWVTSQGHDGKGGNSVGIFQVRYRSEETILKSSDPRNSALNSPISK
jgi:DNA-binding beta-propeller fold protein YncE